MHVVSVKKQPKQLNKPTKGTARRMKLLVLFMLCVFSWAGVNFWNQAGKLEDRQAKVNVLDHKLAEVKQVNEETKREISRLNDNEYIEQKLRKDYGFVKAGETLFLRPKTGK
jgi:cell division protein DivIC